MKEKTLVSVIIPNYNHAPFLEERIESVLNQTFQDFEIILLDDRSTDNSLDILHHYKKHPKVKHFEVNTINSGSVFKQWVKGINLAKSKYTWIAESDDVAHPMFLEKMISFAEQKDNLGLVFCNSIEINEFSNQTGTLLKQKELDKPYFTGEEDMSKFILKKLIIKNVSSVIFKTISFNHIDKNIIKSFSNLGDIFTYAEISLKRRCYYLDEFLNYFRRHNNNTSLVNNRNKKIYYDRIELTHYFMNKLEYDSSKKNLVFYYNKYFLISLNRGIYIQNIKIIRTFHDHNCINFNFYVKLLIFVAIHSTKIKIPWRLGKYYTNMLQQRSLENSNKN